MFIHSTFSLFWCSIPFSRHPVLCFIQPRDTQAAGDHVQRWFVRCDCGHRCYRNGYQPEYSSHHLLRSRGASFSCFHVVCYNTSVSCHVVDWCVWCVNDVLVFDSLLLDVQLMCDWRSLDLCLIFIWCVCLLTFFMGFIHFSLCLHSLPDRNTTAPMCVCWPRLRSNRSPDAPDDFAASTPWAMLPPWGESILVLIAQCVFFFFSFFSFFISDKNHVALGLTSLPRNVRLLFEIYRVVLEQPFLPFFRVHRLFIYCLLTCLHLSLFMIYMDSSWDAWKHVDESLKLPPHQLHSAGIFPPVYASFFLLFFEVYRVVWMTRTRAGDNGTQK